MGQIHFRPREYRYAGQCHQGKILSTLNSIAKSLTENDNLFIFYAGHGIIKRYEGVNGKKVREEGFLIPSNAAKGDEVTFINSYDITSILNRSNAKHILFTADACFAGSLFRDLPADASLKVREAYKNKSRRLLTSGNKQAVSDESDFVESFRLALQENTKKYVTAGELVDGFRDQYISKTHMQLQYNPIPNVDDQGGEFVFFKRQ
ncbi:MAG: caspase family protein [Chitinophagaceae bacterium]|nr:caspase family protein [Chitinophagaceae bacterium]